MSEEEKKQVVQKAKTGVLIEIVLAFIFSPLMNMLLGSIVIFQILAHLPIADMILPANSLQQFEIMIDVVSLDFFSPTDYLELGMTETDPWSLNFAMIGYDSVNFIEQMGSILLIGIFQAICGALALVISLMKIRAPCRMVRSNDVLQNSTIFMTGAFFEILVCVSISMLMLTYYDELVEADDMSLVFQFIFMVVIIVFIGFVSYFSFFVSPKLAILKQGQRYREREAKLTKIRAEFKR